MPRGRAGRRRRRCAVDHAVDHRAVDHAVDHVVRGVDVAVVRRTRRAIERYPGSRVVRSRRRALRRGDRLRPGAASSISGHVVITTRLHAHARPRGDRRQRPRRQRGARRRCSDRLLDAGAANWSSSCAVRDRPARPSTSTSGSSRRCPRRPTSSPAPAVPRHRRGGLWSVNEPDGTSTWLPVERPSDRQGDLDVRTHRARPASRRSPTGAGVDRPTPATATTWAWDQDEPMASYLVTARRRRLRPSATDDPDRRVCRCATSCSRRTPATSTCTRRYVDDQLDVLRRRCSGRTRSTATASRSPTPRRVSRWRPRGCRCSARPTSTARSDTCNNCSCRTSSRTSGSVTPCRPHAGTTSGSTRASPPTAQWMWLDHVGLQPTRRRCVQNVARGVAGGGGGPVDRPDELFGAVSYDGGAVALHALRRTIGDDAFFAGLRAWVARPSRRLGHRPTTSGAQMEAVSGDGPRRRSSMTGSKSEPRPDRLPCHRAIVRRRESAPRAAC